MSADAALSTQPEVQAAPPVVHGKGRRLSRRELGIMLQLHEAGRSGADIAQALDCAESTVSRNLDALADNRVLARRQLEAAAPKLVATIVKSKDAATALRTLGKLDVVREDVSGGGSQVVVMIGTGEQPLSPPIITLPGETVRNQA